MKKTLFIITLLYLVAISSVQSANLYNTGVPIKKVNDNFINFKTNFYSGIVDNAKDFRNFNFSYIRRAENCEDVMNMLFTKKMFVSKLTKKQTEKGEHQTFIEVLQFEDIKMSKGEDNEKAIETELGKLKEQVKKQLKNKKVAIYRMDFLYKDKEIENYVVVDLETNTVVWDNIFYYVNI